MWTIFKVFIEFVTILLLFYVWGGLGFGHEACGILVLRPGIEPRALALKGEVPTIGPPGMFPGHLLMFKGELGYPVVQLHLIKLPLFTSILCLG